MGAIYLSKSPAVNPSDSRLIEAQGDASGRLVSAPTAQPGVTIGATQDAGPSWTGSIGVGGQGVTSANASITPLIITDAPASGQKVVLDDLIVSVDTQMLLTIRTTSDNKILYRIIMQANTAQQFTTRDKCKAQTKDETLEILAGASGNIYATAFWHSEA